MALRRRNMVIEATGLAALAAAPVRAQQALPLRFLDPDAVRTEVIGLRTRLQQLWTAHAWRD